MHQEHKGALDKAQLRGRILREGESVPQHRALPQGHKEARGMGRAAIWGGQGLARVETLQAQALRESEHRSAAQSCRAERKEALGFRDERTEGSSAGSRPAPAGS